MPEYGSQTATHPKLTEALSAISRVGLRANFCSPWHLKIGRFNYFWTTGTITIDAGPFVQTKGVSEFIALVRAGKILEMTPVRQPTNHRLTLVEGESAGLDLRDTTELDPPF